MKNSNPIQFIRMHLVPVVLAAVLIVAACVGGILLFGNSEPEVAGVLNIKVNPEFNLYYDGEGKTVKVEAVNDDGTELLAELGDVNGMDLADAAKKLTLVIGDAGYLETVDGVAPTITITFLQGGHAETAWEPDETLVENVWDSVLECAFNNDWQIQLTAKTEGVVLNEINTLTAENSATGDETSEPEVSEPEVSEPEESSQEEVSQPEESSKPVEQSKPTPEKKPEPSKPQPKPEKEESENVTVKPDPTPEVSEDDQHSEGDLTDEQLEALSTCEHCGKKYGDGTGGTCIRWLNGDTCPNCGEEVPGRTCHSCP